jgi:hypothetical protein
MGLRRISAAQIAVGNGRWPIKGAFFCAEDALRRLRTSESVPTDEEHGNNAQALNQKCRYLNKFKKTLYKASCLL